MPARPLQPFDAGLLASSFIFSLETAILLAKELVDAEPGAVEGTDTLVDADAVECLINAVECLDVCESLRVGAHQGVAHPDPGPSARLLP